MPDICIIGVNFYPEDTAIGLYSYQMACFLEDSGWRVSVITGFPYYPQWKIYPDYRGKNLFVEEAVGSIRVLRYRQYVPNRPSLLKRLLHLFDLTLGSLVNIFRIRSADVVLCVVPFTGMVFPAWILARMKRARLWVHVQDFEVDALFESGLASNSRPSGLLYRAMAGVERFFFDRADVVSTISHGMLRKLSGKTSSRRYLFPNWINAADVDPGEAQVHELYQRGDECFSILYSGNIGEKQDWDFFVDLVRSFSPEDRVCFYVVGSGARSDHVKSLLSRCDHVVFSDPVPYEALNDLLCSADLHVLFQKESVVDAVMPSKLLGMMASAVPSLVTGNRQSEVASVLLAAQGEGFFDAKDLSGCVAFIKELRADPGKKSNLGVMAREYVISHFDSGSVLKAFDRELARLVREENSAG